MIHNRAVGHVEYGTVNVPCLTIETGAHTGNEQETDNRCNHSPATGVSTALDEHAARTEVS